MASPCPLWPAQSPESLPRSSPSPSLPPGPIGEGILVLCQAPLPAHPSPHLLLLAGMRGLLFGQHPSVHTEEPFLSAV